MTFAFATSILVPALLVAAAAFATFAFCATSYQRALASERNAWWMRGPCGRIFLALDAPPTLAVFWLSSLPRFRVLLDARMAAEAQQKCKSLAAEHARVSDAAPAPSSSADSSQSTAIEVGRSANIWFFGSSTFTYWTRLAHDVQAACSEIEPSFNARIFNAAFGGACTRHILQHFEALLAAVPRAPPDVIVFFCGTNDINTRASLASADRACAAILDLSPFGNEIALNFSAFLLRVRERHPSVRAIYLENTVTPFVVAQGEERVAAFDALNEAMRKFCALPHNRAKFVASGAFQRQPAHYLGDRHHLNVEGHAHLARLLAPALVKSI